MNLYLLSLVFFLNIATPKTPNFYPSYIAAKEASKNYQKDLLIFFSKKSCTECDAAWANFEKDQVGTKIFISTLVDMQDFDGAVIMDKYGLNSAPSWVILDAEGNLKQKWAGEWKNPHVRPETPAVAQEPKPEAKPIPVFKATTASSTPSGSTTTAQVATPVKEPVKVAPATPVETKPATPSMTTPAPEVIASGYVLQAGYFGSEANASKLVTDLKGKGFESYTIKTTVQNGTTFYRVISGSFSSEAEANNQLQALTGAGIKASVKKMTDL